MILEERPDGAGAGKESPRLQGCDSPMQMRCSQLQSRRARIHQQIDKELQMRTGAENLYRATATNPGERDVALELSYVNSNLQLGALGSGVYPGREAVTVPMIPLGLEGDQGSCDWSYTELISVHLERMALSYEAEIRELGPCPALQAMATPSRNEAGLGADSQSYYNQLCSWTRAFSPLPGGLGLFFHCLTDPAGTTPYWGPGQQRALASRRGTISSTSAPSTRRLGRARTSCAEGGHRAVEVRAARAAGPLATEGEFSHAHEPASLCALEQLMMPRPGMCVCKGPHTCLLAPQDCLWIPRVPAMSTRQVATMAQPPSTTNMPVSWTALVPCQGRVLPASLPHYYVAMALCTAATEGELPNTEQVFPSPPTSCKPQGPVLPQELEERRSAHLKRAILGQEEALRLHALCRVLREVDLLRAVVAQTLQRSLAKYAELDREDDFCETAEAPDIQPKTHQKPEARTPRLSQGKGPDIFHRLGPLSVFSAKNRWRLVGPIHLTRGEGGFGLTLRGDSPVLIAAVIPGSQAAAAGLKEGDYIVSVNGQPCRWWRHAEVVAELKAAGEAGASLQVVSVLPSSRLPWGPGGVGDRRPALLGPRGLLSSQREHSCMTLASTWASPRPLLSWSRKAQQGKPGGCPQPRAPVKPALPSSSKRPGWL
uniref:Rhophilin Rho GTPase binding protein 1 n=1 Tax=Rhinopithecus bieti TaxID=61621 RepID=A0A2K6N2S7_RHIBE